MRPLLIATALLMAVGCFPNWDLLDPSLGTSTGSDGGAGATGGGGTGGSGGSASGVGGTATGVGGSVGGGGMEPLGPWSTPQIVPELSHAADDDDPTITADGLELFFNSHRNGGGTGADIWVTKRDSVDDPWGPPELVVELSSAETEGNQTVSPDGLTMWLQSDRLMGVSQIFIATRPDRDSPWSMPVTATDINFQGVLDVGGVTADGLALLGHIQVTGANSELVLLQRGSTGQAWGAAVPIDELNTPDKEDEAWLHPDGTVAYFGSNRLPSLGGKDLWYSTRGSTDDPWGPAVHDEALSSDVSDTDPTLTPDLRYVLFARHVGPNGEREIFSASR